MGPAVSINGVETARIGASSASPASRLPRKAKRRCTTNWFRSGSGIDDAAAVEVTERKETELEGGHDPQVALAAAHQCKQLGLGVGVDPPQRAVGRDNLHAADMVRRETV